MIDPGLVQGSCSHDRQEYRDCRNGEETWSCLSCGELLLHYIDCGSGG